MTLSPEEFLIVARALAGKAADIPECGFVNISPMSFVDKADFQANIGDMAMNTRTMIETANVALTTLTLRNPPQKPESHGEPWVYTFNYNVFRESSKKRLDESNTPDEFQKKILKSYYDFLTAVLNLNAVFGSEETAIDGLPETILEATVELTDADDVIAEDEPGRYIRSVSGFSADVSVKVSITFQEC